MQVKLIKHIKFLLSSSNQHGVHSPFVFEYLTKCLYRKKVYSESKTLDVLLKSISHFEYNAVQVIGNAKVKDLVKEEFDTIKFNQQLNDLIFFDEVVPNLLSEVKIHNGLMVLINNIHRNRNTTELWNRIVKDEKSIVTIDFFHCGAVFFRQEQVKEHFKIRI